MTLMHRLFPPPTYEMPDDVFFEVTGVLQLFAVLPAIYYTYRSIRAKIMTRKGREPGARDGENGDQSGAESNAARRLVSPGPNLVVGRREDH
jgi:hypothetical protein